MLGVEQSSLLQQLPALGLDPRPEGRVEVGHVCGRTLGNQSRALIGTQLLELTGGDGSVRHKPSLPANTERVRGQLTSSVDHVSAGRSGAASIPDEPQMAMRQGQPDNTGADLHNSPGTRTWSE